MFFNAAQASLRTAEFVEFCFMTTTKACQGTGVSGSERASVWDWVLARVRVGKGLGYVLELGEDQVNLIVRGSLW